MGEDPTSEEKLAAEIELLRKERAATLIKEVDRAAIDAAETRADLATEVAYKAGVEAARIDSRLETLDRSVKGINENIETTSIALHELKDEVIKMREASIARDASAKALAGAVEARSSQQVTTRMFLFSLIGAVGTISGVLWAAVGNI